MKISRQRLSRAGLLLLSLGWAGPVMLGAQETPASAAAASTAEPAKPPSKFRDPVDGEFDVSGFIATAYGFVPIAMPITEPAVGYGLGAGLVFIDKPDAAQGKFARPNISAVGGLYTENGTKGVFGMDSRYWLDGKLQTLVAGLGASVNLDYYGEGNDGPLRGHPLRYNLEPKGGLLQAKTKLGDSRFFAGLGYLYMKMDVSFTAPPTTPGLPSFRSSTTLAALMPSLAYDTRDNVFTPTHGFFAEVGGALFGESVGGDQNFQNLSSAVIYYTPLAEKLTLGVRGDYATTFGDTPFYANPSVSLRGVPAMSYMGDQMAQLEAELRWQCWGRWSLVGFSGVGAVWGNSSFGRNEKNVLTYGTGIRYEIARKFGLHMGLDVAFGPADPVIYIQFGSAWMRP